MKKKQKNKNPQYHQLVTGYTNDRLVCIWFKTQAGTRVTKLAYSVRQEIHVKIDFERRFF